LVRDQIKYQKRSQIFVRMNKVPLSIIAVCVSNPDCSPFAIHG
jgi:hypothetical protein